MTILWKQCAILYIPYMLCYFCTLYIVLVLYLQVAASDPAKVAGFLQLSTNKGKSWAKRWVTVHQDAMLYTFKTHKVRADKGVNKLAKYNLFQYAIDRFTRTCHRQGVNVPVATDFFF